MTKLMILAGIFTAIAYQPAHAQLYDYASEQAYGRRVNMAPLIDKTGAPCVTVLPARGAMFAFRLRREKTEDTAVSRSRQ